MDFVHNVIAFGRVPFFHPPGLVLLDVTLRRDGQVRRWTINTGDRLTDNAVTVSGCFSEEEVSAKVREWKAQIFAARADGWS